MTHLIYMLVSLDKVDGELPEGRRGGVAKPERQAALQLRQLRQLREVGGPRARGGAGAQLLLADQPPVQGHVAAPQRRRRPRRRLRVAPAAGPAAVRTAPSLASCDKHNTKLTHHNPYKSHKQEFVF